MKILIYRPEIVALLLFSLDVFSVDGSVLPLFHVFNINDVKNNNAGHPHVHVRLSKSRKPRSTFPSILSFTTLRHFEKDEEESDCKLWVDLEPDDEHKRQDHGYDDDMLRDDDMDDIDTKSEKIDLQWWKKFRTEARKSINDNTVIKDCDEHPMRTDEWLIRVKLSPFCVLSRGFDRESSLSPHSIFISGRKNDRGRIREQVMKFSKNGFVVLIENPGKEDNIDSDDSSNCVVPEHENCQRIVSAGRWHMNVNGISWTMQSYLPSRMNHCCDAIDSIDDETLIDEHDSLPDTTCLYYHADIHLSKFQAKPRMFKGTIVRDRICKGRRSFSKKLFRPVVASFTAEGIGEDTLALSYKERGFGLNNNGN